MPIIEATGGMGGSAALVSGGAESSTATMDATTQAISDADAAGVTDVALIRQRIADSVALALLDQQDAEAASIDDQRAVRLAALQADADIAAAAKAERDAARAEIMGRQ